MDDSGSRTCAAVFVLLLTHCASSFAATGQPQDFEELPPGHLVASPPFTYPYQARVARLEGSGVAVVRLDRATGKVTSVKMEPSTGHALLDHEAMSTLRRWRFKPGTFDGVRIPITFTVREGPRFEIKVKKKSAEEILSAFLGPGMVVRGGFPEYPRLRPWFPTSGTGVYEIHVRKDGSVEKVRILKSSQDAMFDDATVKTLSKWRLRRGPLIIELPLAFTLTPTTYSVAIPRRH